MNVKTPTGFLNISSQECGIIYKVVQLNAERHYRVSAILAKSNEYPNAISHLILGTEELIKALALFLEGKEFNLRKVEGYKRLFTNHRTRHSIVKEFYSVSIILKKIISIGGKKENESWIKYWLMVIQSGLSSLIQAFNNHEWWENADILKQNCFYVDYNKKIISPESITGEEYKVALSHVMEFRKDVRVIIIALSRISEIELKKIRKSFLESDIIGLLSETISRASAK